MIVEQPHSWHAERRREARLYAAMLERPYRGLLLDTLPEGMNALLAKLTAAEARRCEGSPDRHVTAVSASR